MGRIDLHVHSHLSPDGELLPGEILRRAELKGHRAVAVTDHVDASNLEEVLEALLRFCREGAGDYPVSLVPGVELTDVPPEAIARLARRSRELGAAVVVVHGETVAEHVWPGTNRAAAGCPEVDVLGHPGLLSAEDARLAAEAGVYLEITARRSHALTNGRVARLAVEAGAGLVVNSDAHGPDDLIELETARTVALGAGLEEVHARRALEEAPLHVLRRRGIRL